MQFKFTDEQEMVQSMVRDFSRDVLAATAMERDHKKEFSFDNFNQMAELGLMGMMIPPEYNGAGLDTVTYLIALIEIGYGCAATAVVMSVHNSIVCGSIHKFGTDEQKEKYLKPLAAGEYIGAFAQTEPNVGSDPSRQSTTAVRDGDYYILNGTKRFITTGMNAGLTIVTAVTDREKRHKGISTFIVPKDTPGFKVGKIEDKMGLRSSDTTDQVFDDCRVPVANLLGKEGEGFKVAMSGLDAGRIGIAGQSVGVGQAALDAAVQYAKEREQFGHPIAEFQGIRWMLADMAMDVEAARQLVFSAAAMKDRGEDCSSQASMAKLYASEMANRVAGQAVQIHGGYGYSKEYDVERYYRDARVLTIYEGTSEIQRVVISNRLLKNK